MSLSEQQAAYVNATGNTVLCACPGSGKTFAVVEKAKKLMREWDKSHCGIAVLSFTNVAIDEIKKAILTEQGIAYPHYFGTVDSFIDDVFLRYAGSFFASPRRPHIIFEHDTTHFQWRPECYSKGCVSDIVSFHWNANLELLHSKRKVSCPPDRDKLTPCYRYKKQLLQKGIVYQIDVPMLCTRVLQKHPQIAQAIAKRYPVIIIDEAQDTSKEQMAFFDLLRMHGVRSIDLIGDPDQSIYEWRNATPECFVQKMTDEDWNTLYLTENRRSSQLICNATAAFSKTLEGKAPTTAVGDCMEYPQKPQLLLLAAGKTEADALAQFREKCGQLGIPDETVAILTRKAIYTERKVKGLWKSQEVKLFANAAYEWLYGSRKQAFSYCEQALYLMCVDDLDNQQKPIEQEIEKQIAYQEWRKGVLTILIGLPSANIALSEWITGLKSLLQGIQLPLTFREKHSINDVIKIKKSDNEQPDFQSKPLKRYFQQKDTASVVRSSIHGVKGETYDAVLMLALQEKGTRTLTRELLCTGELNCETMRIAYVAMTWPRKYLAVAIAKPSNTDTLRARFPQEQWEYVYVD